jgi:thioredoxin reductase (NADPH)
MTPGTVENMVENEKQDQTVASVEKSIIIGSGPAGYTAGIYLGRAGYHPLMITGSITAGGQLINTTQVDNYPGFADGINGPDLMDAMKNQAERFGTRFVADDVTSIDVSRETFTVHTATKSYRALSIILATGSGYRHLNIPGEKEYGGKGVSYCATCDGFFFRGKKIVVIGGGDSAFQDAQFLSRFGDVTLIHRREGFRASQILVDTVRKNPKISLVLDTIVTKIIGDGNKVTGLELHNKKTGNDSTMNADGVFVAIGSVPNTSFLNQQVNLDDHGYVKVQGASTRTSVPGIFAAGDVADPHYRQAISAAGMGCRAALDAQSYLESLK